MALGTEAPSTGSRKEPSRLEQNTNQRLTEHNHSPHQHGGRAPVHFTQLRVFFPTVRDEWMHLKSWPKWGGALHKWMCLCRQLWKEWESGCKYGVKNTKRKKPPKHAKPRQDWSATAMLASALRSASRVQNTNTNCPHNTGLLSDSREEWRKKWRVHV